MTTPPEGERAKLAGEVTEGDRALWESLCRLNACAANVEDYQEESVALIAKFRASVAVAEAESKVAALEVENKRLVAVLGMVKSSIREKDGGVIKLAYFTPSEVLMIDLALAPADEKVSKAALQPAPKV